MSETMPNPAEAAATAPPAWDPFQLMDRLDEEALRKELDGVAGTDLVYVVKEGGQEVVGLSKTGVDECCMALVSQGQVIREEDLQYEVIGDGDDREALFKVKAARFAVSPAGQEVRLDQVIGVKRQPLYFEPAQLDLDARVPSKKHRGRTYRELLQFDEGRDYLAWMAEHFSEPAIRDFVRQILAGDEITARRERQLNPHWYEAGAMKAARNARFRLIPGQRSRSGHRRARAQAATPAWSRPGRAHCAAFRKPRQQTVDPRRRSGPHPSRSRRRCPPRNRSAASVRTRPPRSRWPSTSAWPIRRCSPRTSGAAPRVAGHEGHPADDQGPDRLAQAPGGNPKGRPGSVGGLSPGKPETQRGAPYGAPLFHHPSPGNRPSPNGSPNFVPAARPRAARFATRRRFCLSGARDRHCRPPQAIAEQAVQ